MADLTSGSLKAAIAVAGSFSLELFGVPHGALLAALLGGFFGAGRADIESAWGRVSAFLVASAGGALIGTLGAPTLAARIPQQSEFALAAAQNIVALTAAVYLLPTIAYIGGRFRTLADRALERFGIKPDQPQVPPPDGAPKQ